MPYVPSKKTDGKSPDREILDAAVERVAQKASEKIRSNLSLIDVYRHVFVDTAQALQRLRCGQSFEPETAEENLAQAIFRVSEPYKYQGAYLGECNYAFTRFIQRVPQMKVANGVWSQELRYWLYAATVEALILASRDTLTPGIGLGGVFEDIKDEYKRRVNTAYEAEQIVKSGDCYDTPFYTRLVEVVDSSGIHVGHMEVMLKRSPETLYVDRLPGKLVLQLQ